MSNSLTYIDKYVAIKCKDKEIYRYAASYVLKNGQKERTICIGCPLQSIAKCKGNIVS